MKRTFIDAWLDSISFVFFSFLLSTGILMNFLLPPGSGKWVTVWGWNRHDWGNLHFWLAIGFVLVILAHLWTHRRWIVAVIIGKVEKYQRQRSIYGLIASIAVVAFAVAPLISGVDSRF